jgi:hypothetical protein
VSLGGQPAEVSQTAPVLNLPEITTARLALLISIALALWNLAKHRLEGGRVRIRMRPGLHFDHGLSQARTWETVAEHATKRGGWSVEVAVVEVENVGRTAVTISGVGLAFRSRPWWRHKRRTVVPFGREAPGAMTATSHRLEPFDSATFVFDVWEGLEKGGNLGTPVRPLTVRAITKVAGRRRLRLSPWRSRWEVTEGQEAFIPALAKIDMLAYRRMARHTRGDQFAEMATIPTAIEMGKQFPRNGSAPTREQVQELFERSYFGESKVACGLLAFFVAHDLKPLYRSAAPPAKSEQSPSEDGGLVSDEESGQVAEAHD